MQGKKSNAISFRRLSSGGSIGSTQSEYFNRRAAKNDFERYEVVEFRFPQYLISTVEYFSNGQQLWNLVDIFFPILLLLSLRNEYLKPENWAKRQN
jgi:hypothetical protein